MSMLLFVMAGVMLFLNMTGVTFQCELTLIHEKKTLSCHEANMEPTEISVYGSIYELLCSGGSKFLTKMMRARTRRKKDTFLIIHPKFQHKSVAHDSRARDVKVA